MNPFLPAIAFCGCYLLVIQGWNMVRDRGPVQRFDDYTGQVDEDRPVRVGILMRLIERLGDRFGPRAAALMGERQLARARRRLDAAGRPMSTEAYVGRKAAYTLLFGFAGMLLALNGAWIFFVLCALLGWLWVDIWLGGAARRRQAQIDHDLPDFLDILAVTVAAGVGFRPAMMRVSEALGGPLAEEVLLSLRQMDLGASRREAFLGLRRRNESESLATFVTALLQAEELGVPLTDALVDLAGDMRRSFHQKARRRAARAAPRVSLITTMVIVPGAVILIIAGLFVGSDLDIGSLVNDL